MSYLIDSDWLIDALAGIPMAIETQADRNPSGIFISIITFGEVIEGAYRSPEPERHLDTLQRFAGVCGWPLVQRVARCPRIRQPLTATLPCETL